MCRIVGVLSTQKKIETSIVEKMRDSLSHGGPDDCGFYLGKNIAMGHRRLSIIDLSQDAHQPFIADDIVVVYNGEVYNFRELKLLLEKEGHHFVSESDTEVIIKAYLEWGEDSFEKLHGMFAFALLDKRNNTLYLVRDHSGIKPLYFYYDDHELIFASEIRAFYHYDAQWKKSDHWQELFLSFGHIPEPYTILHNVHMLAKGTFCKFNMNGKIIKQQHCYAQFDFSEAITDYDTAIATVRNSLQNAIERHLISDAPLGIFLSGGIDSSLIALVAKQFKSDLCTLSIVFDDSSYSEEKYQQMIVDKISSKHTAHKITYQDFFESLPDIFQKMDQPTTDGVNSYFVSRCAQQAGLKAVLAGIGGDELFAGYTTFGHGEKLLNLFLPKLFAKLGLLLPHNLKRLTFLQLNNPYRYYLVLRGFFRPDEIAMLLGKSEKSIWDFLQQLELETPRCSPRNYISHLELDLYMKNQLLRDSDVMGMGHSLEIRVPFLDASFLKDIFCIEEHLRLSKRFPKCLLVESFADLLPKEVAYRKKQGFVVPFARWLQDHGRESFHDKVTKSALNDKFCTDLWTKFVQGKIHWSKIWAIWVLCEYTDS
ncbi:asparagine synthase (glutamine-hydrolyzing) [Candidatus Uabimicrobium amorphum]|uniref:asparagine synthase (glutamine-hydrolyzing) n=1 Tax=Uabimicrobium amorphum TaxID=2596890 RepID=A0A5S9F6N3_UABAM|nr:asparagine synthase (glutamine-hydrolyzing) [Candidatus Uabimicrobium amorphum]BBM88056.1 amidotransferase 1, exosortase Asystem-associated [Candidatus Uabimicrobium amorphum]